MNKKKTILVIILGLVTFPCFICDSGSTFQIGNYKNLDDYNETFKSADKPPFNIVDEGTHKYKFRLPWNYDNSYNKKRKYPLLIYLHGSGQKIETPNAVPEPLGGGDSFVSEYALQQHPSFIYFPQWDYNDISTIINKIEEFISTYRIDTKRIYLAGYSMGGSGSYLLLKDYYNSKGRLFAGILRFSGQNNYNAEKITALTNVWIHCGQQDTAYNRLELAKAAYHYLKNLYGSKAYEITQEITFNDHNRSYTALTKTLVYGNSERFKLSVCPGLAHNTSHIPFNNPDLVEWLYSRKIH